MSAEQLLHPLLIAAVFAFAGFIKLRKAEYAEVFSYWVVSAWFWMVYVFPDMTVITSRVMGRYVLFQIAAVTIFFHGAFWYHKRRYKKALEEGGINAANTN